MFKLITVGIALGYGVFAGGIVIPCHGQGQAHAGNEAYSAPISTHVAPSFTMEAAPKSSLPSYMRPPPPMFKYIKVPTYPAGIKLSTAMQSAIREFDPGFRIWNSTEYPSVLYVYRGFTFSPSSDVALSVGIGDFNGDGDTDAVVAGHDTEFEMVLVLISSRTVKGLSYDVMPICTTNDDLYQKKYHSDMHAYCGALNYTRGSSGEDFIGKPQIFIRRIIKKGTCLTNYDCEGDCPGFCLKADAFENFGIGYPGNSSDSPKMPGLGPRDLFRWDFEPGKYDPYDFVRYGIY